MTFACCAMQIIESAKHVRVDKLGVPLEAALTKDMHHLGVLRTRTWALGPPDAVAAAAARRAARVRGSCELEPTCWMVTDYCDKGTLGVSRIDWEALFGKTCRL